MDETNNVNKFETGHIGLNVRDLERSKKFYRDVFGLELLDESKGTDKLFAFLGTNGQTMITLWQQSQNVFDKQTAGLHHLSFKVGSIELVKETEEFLKSIDVKFHYHGIVPHGEGSHSGGIFFEDPDGIRLEVFSPTNVNENQAPHKGAPSCGFF